MTLCVQVLFQHNWPKREHHNILEIPVRVVLHVNPTFTISFVLYAGFARAPSKFAYTARAVRAKNKKYCNGKVYMKRHLNDSLKNIMVFSGLANQHCLGERGTAETGSYNNILKG